MELKSTRALVVGLARTGAATARFLAARGAQVTVSEVRPEKEVAEAAAELRSLGVEVECGGHTDAAFQSAELIVPSPGVSLDLAILKTARQKGIEVISELELAGRFLQGTVVAVTGSNGKTTTTALLGRIFSHAGRPTQVGGNIGTPLIGLVETATDDTINVVEASSFQLEAVTSFRPRVAALLNLSPDHLDRHASMREYVAAKARLFGYQQSEDFAIFNADDPLSADLGPEVQAQRFWFSRRRRVDLGAYIENGCIAFSNGPVRERVLDSSSIRLKGEHNLENVLAAVCAARLLGIVPSAIRDAVSRFEGVEHRLELVSDIRGVSYYNDSKATNVDAAMKAVNSFSGGLVVILGGKDKGGDFRPLGEALRRRAKHVLLIGKAREKIAAQLPASLPLESLETLPEAVARASEMATTGDTVLLAPGCASFDQFENFEHRGRVFKEEVRRLLDPSAAKQAVRR